MQYGFQHGCLVPQKNIMKLSFDKVLATGFLGQHINIAYCLFANRKNNSWDILDKIIRKIDRNNQDK